MALTEATQEAIWLKAFLCELGEMKSDEAVKIYEDNQGSIALAKNPEFHKRTKHIDIRCCQESASSSLGIPVNRLPTTFTRGAYDYGTLIMGR
ncbi:unnamed protein product [Phytophthora lilii]|uniref:Unnamed protein product n=1 Tax=Phytophthora lilii TaxID=2077276 RepID=A0A9W6Y2X1_9STRA|nr:unnamed protein product [Phytophthora lilii]